jgi:hypothetical protein
MKPSFSCRPSLRISSRPSPYRDCPSGSTGRTKTRSGARASATWFGVRRRIVVGLAWKTEETRMRRTPEASVVGVSQAYSAPAGMTGACGGAGGGGAGAAAGRADSRAARTVDGLIISSPGMEESYPLSRDNQ